MAFDWELAAGLADTAGGLFGVGYNAYTNKRDFDYQKALQQTMFEREDTAVQRRLDDMKAAGINPNLAAGSAAAAGTVVSRSNTNDLNIGSALDNVMAVNQIKKQREETQALQNENKTFDYLFNRQNEDWKIQRLQNLYALGFNPEVSYGSDGKLHIKGDITSHKYSTTSAAKLYDIERNYMDNSNNLLNKELTWYNANQLSNVISNYLGALPIPRFNFSGKIGGR